MCGLASMYPAFVWSVLCSRPSWVSARVRPHEPPGLKGRPKNQCSHALGRPFLHLFSSSRRPRWENCSLDYMGSLLALSDHSLVRCMVRPCVARGFVALVDVRYCIDV